MTGGKVSRKARRSGPASWSALTGRQRHDVGDGGFPEQQRDLAEEVALAEPRDVVAVDARR